MATYRYLFADLLTNTILAELPITGVNFTQTLNAAGTFTGRLLLSDIESASFNIPNSTIPGRTALYVDRDGVLVWGGVIWFREYNSVSQKVQLTGREFESYFERRRITTNNTFTNIDQFIIAESLVNTAQSVANGNIGVVVPTTTSGVLVSRTYYSYELKSVYSALLDLSRSNNGFDFNIAVAYDGVGVPRKTLNLSYPQSGTRYVSTNPAAPVLEFPAGNIIEYTYPEDGSLAANNIYAVGAGSNEGKFIALATDTTKLANGWPVLEDSVNYSDLTDTALITRLASGQVAAVSYPPTTIQVIAPPYQNPVLGSYAIGDDFRVRITDERFPLGLDTVYRLVALNVTPGEDNPERVTMTLTLPTAGA